MSAAHYRLASLSRAIAHVPVFPGAPSLCVRLDFLARSGFSSFAFRGMREMGDCIFQNARDAIYTYIRYRTYGIAKIRCQKPSDYKILDAITISTVCLIIVLLFIILYGARNKARALD